MDSEDFVQALIKIGPTQADLDSVGYNGVQQELFLKIFNIQRKKSVSAFGKNECVFDLFSKFEIGDLDFCDVVFKDELEHSQDFVFFADHSFYSIAINIKSGEIEAVDIESDYNENIPCAKDSCSYLAALVHCCQYMVLKILGKVERNDANNKIYRDLCIKAAGGSKYEYYYNEILIW